MARKKQDPFPCRDHLDLLAFSIECIFLVFRDNDKILASGHRGGFQQAFDFPFSRTRIHISQVTCMSCITLSSR